MGRQDRGGRLLPLYKSCPANIERRVFFEFELANSLIEKLSSEDFEPKGYEDEYQTRVAAMIDSKVKGQEIT
jgi:non-homologous end joining protein Ku